jgi:hypothetical protein
MFSSSIFFFSSKKKKLQRKKELSFKLPLCPFIFGSHFYPLTFVLLFQTFSPDSSIRKEKKNVEKGENLLSSSHSTFSPLVLASGLLFLPFCFKCFLLGIFFFSSKRKEKKNTKKKKCKEGREVTFLLSLLHLG